MAISETSRPTAFDEYISEIRSIWGDGKDPQLPFKVKALMEKMLTSTRMDEPWMAQMLQENKSAKELYRDPEHGFVQMGHIHRQGHKNPPHDHGPCWVVYGAYSGLTEITLYKRVDDGKEPGRAKLEVQELHRLSPGVVNPYLKGQTHAVQAIEYPAVVFRFLSYDLEKVERSRYDLEKGTVSVI